MNDTTKLEALLAALPVRRAPDGWRDRVQAAIAVGIRPSDIRPESTRRPRWIAASTALVAAAAAAIALYVVHDDARAPSIAMHVSHHDHEYRIVSARVGDTLVIRAEAVAGFRVYSNGSQLARCPGHIGCRRESHGLELALPLFAVGTVAAIAYTPALPDPAPGWQPSAIDLDTDLGLAVGMQITMTMSAPIEVH